MFCEPYLLMDRVKRERMYSGVFPEDASNIITALLYFSCFVNEKSLKSVQSVIGGDR